VTRCPPSFPPGHYWYRGCCNGPGRPPKWIDRFVNGENENGSQSTGKERASDCVSEVLIRMKLMDSWKRISKMEIPYTTQDSDRTT